MLTNEHAVVTSNTTTPTHIAKCIVDFDFDSAGRVYHSHPAMDTDRYSYQHIHILSNDEVSVGEYLFDEKRDRVWRYDGGPKYNDKKILASTNSDLIASPYCLVADYVHIIPEDFVELFIINPRDTVILEYARYCTQNGNECGMTCLSEATCNDNISPKIKNNTVSIVNL